MKQKTLLDFIKTKINLNGFSYLSHMATSEYDNSVSLWLQENKADAPKAVYGYAVSGNIENMNKLLETYPDDKKLIGQAIRGLARSNLMDHLHAIDGYRAYNKYIVLGLAEGGHFKSVARIVNRHTDLFNLQAQGYANGGHQEELLSLIEGTRFHGDAVFHAAKAGHVQLVGVILEQFSVEEDTVLGVPSSKAEITMLAGLNRALEGFCKGYHYEAAHQLLLKGANIQTALDGLKINGQPNIIAYASLLITAPDELYDSIFDAIQTEFSLSKLTLSDEQIKDIHDLRNAYQEMFVDLLSLLTNLSGKKISFNDFEKLDRYYDFEAKESGKQNSMLSM